MPQIREYKSTSNLRPSDKGTQEWEMVGRRAGPLYAAAGQDIRERARLTAADIEGRDWPLMFLNAYRNIAADREEARAAMLDEKYPHVQIRFNNRSSGDPRFGAGYGMGQGRVGDSAYAAIAGANALSQIADMTMAASAKPIKGGKLVEAPTWGAGPSGDLQRELASDPWSFDDMMRRLTNDPHYSADRKEPKFDDAPDHAEFNRERQEREFGGTFDGYGPSPLSGLPSPSVSSVDSGQKWWKPWGWEPSSWFSPGLDATITEGRENIR